MTAMICEEYTVVRAMGNGAEANGNDWKGAGGDWRLGQGRVIRGKERRMSGHILKTGFMSHPKLYLLQQRLPLLETPWPH